MSTRIIQVPTRLISPNGLPKIQSSPEERAIGAMRLNGGLRAWWQADVGWHPAGTSDWIDRIESRRMTDTLIPAFPNGVISQRAGVFNGNSAINFKDAAMRSSLDDGLLPLTGDFTVITVARIVAGDVAAIWGNSVIPTQATYLQRSAGDALIFATNGRSVAGPAGGAPNANVNVTVCTYNAVKRQIVLRNNKIEVGRSVHTTLLNNNAQFNLGVVGAVGADNFAIADGGMIATAMVFHADLAEPSRAADLTLIENWLTARYIG